MASGWRVLRLAPCAWPNAVIYTTQGSLGGSHNPKGSLEFTGSPLAKPLRLSPPATPIGSSCVRLLIGRGSYARATQVSAASFFSCSSLSEFGCKTWSRPGHALSGGSGTAWLQPRLRADACERLAGRVATAHYERVFQSRTSTSATLCGPS